MLLQLTWLSFANLDAYYSIWCQNGRLFQHVALFHHVKPVLIHNFHGHDEHQPSSTIENLGWRGVWCRRDAGHWKTCDRNVSSVGAGGCMILAHEKEQAADFDAENTILGDVKDCKNSWYPGKTLDFYTPFVWWEAANLAFDAAAVQLFPAPMNQPEFMNVACHARVAGPFAPQKLEHSGVQLQHIATMDHVPNYSPLFTRFCYGIYHWVWIQRNRM
jgi:hypothetical protein